MDKAILYNVKLEKLNKRIDELKSIGFNMDEFEKIKEEIINKNKIDVKNSYNFSSPNLSLNQSAFLEQGYLTSINELEKLYDKLLDYEIYVMAYNTAKLVKEFLESDNKSIENFTKYREKIEQILKYLHNSKTLDYDVEKIVIEEIYNVVYLFIKEEMEYLCHSALLDKFGEIDKSYIDKLVRRDIEQIDLREEKNKSISLKVKEISSNGFDASYADSELILAIVNSNRDVINKRKITLNELNRKLNSYLNSINNLCNNSIEEVNSKENILSLAIDSLKLLFNSTILVGVLLGAYKIGKNISNDKAAIYLTTTTTYNPLNKEEYTITEEYEPYKEDSIQIIDYGKVVSGGKRTVTEYDLSDYQNLSYEELYNMDLSSMIIPEDSYILESEDDNLKNLSNEAFRIINKITVNLEDKKFSDAKERIQLLCICIGLMIDAIYVTTLYNLSVGDYLPILSDIFENISDDLYKLSKDNKNKKENREKIKDITNRLNTLIKENKDLFDKVNLYITNLENNEEYSKEINGLKKKLTLIKNKEKDIFKNI